MMNCWYILLLLCIQGKISHEYDFTNSFKIWGPGLDADKIIMPARYFFIQSPILVENFDDLEVNISGISKSKRPCRIWKNILNRKDGFVIVRYKLYEICSSFEINVLYNATHIGISPVRMKNIVYPDECDCEKVEATTWFKSWQCGPIPAQIINDLSLYSQIDWDKTRDKMIERYNSPNSISICHYIIKDNVVYRKCFGKYVGFKMFMDNILLSLTRKMYLNDNEFFVNLGDWPLVKEEQKMDPVFSWCASTDTFDIVMPTYDITVSTLENMGSVTLDMLSIQGNSEYSWEDRKQQVFWRGRDSNRERLLLILMGRENPDLFNASLTNFFFYRNEEHIYGPKVEHVSFFKFFDYKYQLNVDGTVAAYRFPYLLIGGSLVFKQDSKYYEHFYKELEKDIHYVQVKRDLSDLVEKVKWATEHDDVAKTIAKQAQDFANENLLPKNIFCYYAQLLDEFSKRIVSKIKIQEGMEKVEQPDKTATCKCENIERDEL